MGKFFIARPIFAIALAAAIVLLGIISIFDLPIEQYPDITPPVVEVSTTYPGADAETVNNAVATPVSQSIMGVSDMLYMQATSANDGSMNLQVTFDIGSDPNMDAIFTQNNVSTALSQLPASVTQQGVTTRFPALLYPLGNWVCLLFMAAVLVIMLITPGMAISVYLIPVWIAILGVGYMVKQKNAKTVKAH